MTMLVPSSEGEDGYEWVTMTPDDLLTPGARLWKKIVRRGGIAVLAIIVLFFAAVFGRHVVVSMREAKAIETAALEDPASLSPEEIQRAEEAARAFARTTDIATIKSLVRTPPRVAPMLKDYYRKHPPQAVELGAVIRQKKLVYPDGVFIVLAFEVEAAPGYRFFTAQRTKTGPYLIDWELSSGFQEHALDRFVSEQPASSVPLRVVVRPDNYYDNIFPIEDFVCFHLSYPVKDFQLYGYVRRDSPVLDLLVVNTANRALSMILDLKYEDDPLRDDRVVITDVLKTNWFYGQ